MVKVQGDPWLDIEHDNVEAVDPPHTIYLIAGLPRTGSSLLCDYLQQMGLGFPTEYYVQYARTTYGNRHGAFSPAAYADLLIKLRTRNGYFGGKAVSPDTIKFALQWTPPTHIIEIRRNNRIAQVRSLAVAMDSGQYSLRGEEVNRGREPSDFNQIAAKRYLRYWDIETNLLLEPYKNRLTITYERLTRDTDNTLREVARYLGKTLEPNWVTPTPTLRKQS